MECDSRESIFEGTIRTFNKVRREMTEQFEDDVKLQIFTDKRKCEWILTYQSCIMMLLLQRSFKKCDGDLRQVTPGSDFRSGRFRQLYGTRSRMFRLYWNRMSREWHHPAFLVDDAALQIYHSVFCR